MFTRVLKPRISTALKRLTLMIAATSIAFIAYAGEPVRRIALGVQSVSQSVAKGATATMQTDRSFIDLVVGDPDIADVMPLTNHSFYIHGKKVGATTVTAYDANRRLVGSIDVEVGAPTGRLRADLRQRVAGNVRVSSINGRIMLSGSVPDSIAMDTALTIAKQYGGEVINQMTISEPQQVMLEVRFIEASRQAGRELGVRWQAVSKKVNASVGSSILSGATPFGAVLGHLLSGGASVDVLVQALENKGLARRLAEPNLTTMSGQTASFLAGGEFPFPVVGPNQTVSVEFKKFGVALAFTPVVLANGVINLKIEPEVSQLDVGNSVSINGVSVPGLVVRRLSTTVELRDGQGFALAGLMQSVSSEQAQSLPWINEVPVLGALFRSTSFTRNETELAVLVTPRLVRPVRPGEKLHTPLESTVAANDVESFLLGKQELTPSQARFTRGRPQSFAGGHILDDGDANAAQ
ncbi:MAG: type II and III secretion system protein family protein [Hyphomicrobiales bacterium]|nr:type II and III secretion system protein family protein [Hyphomicrobiales bacterium]